MKYQYNATEVANIIKTRRKELKLTQQQVAEMIGSNKSTISRYESNEIGSMNVESLIPLSKALQCTPMQLLGFEPMTPPRFSDNFDKKLLNRFHCADAKNQKIILQLLDMDEYL